jgi:hypothetical protein
MIGYSILLIGFVSGVFVWTAGIRPHLRRAQRTPIWTAHLGFTALVDCAECFSLARTARDSRAWFLAWMFVASAISILVGFLFLMFG